MGVMGWDLYSTLVMGAEYKAYYDTAYPTACPRCGEPLHQGPPQQPGILYCPHGDFEYPRDWNAETMSGM